MKQVEVNTNSSSLIKFIKQKIEVSEALKREEPE